MFVPNNPTLIGNCDFNGGIILQNNALTAESRLQTWIDGAINEILFLVRDLLEVILTSININMTSAACTYTSAIMVEMDIVVLSDF